MLDLFFFNRHGRRLASWTRAAAGLMLAISVVGVACKTVAPKVRAPEVVGTRPVRELVFAPNAGPGARAPAYRLTASDGTGLRLASLQVRTVVQGPLALTQLHLGFDNPEARTIEGRFVVTMPEGAAISRFAMKIGEQWQEGEVVERMTATQVYETYLHRRIDPALLEHDAGNRFSARVFPIFAGVRKELIISYTQELTDASMAYSLPLQGLPRLDALDVQVFVSGEGGEVRIVKLERSNYVPEGDLLLREQPPRITTGVRHGGLVAARVRLAADPGAAVTTERATGWILLLDTSASQAVDFAGRVARLRPLIAALAAAEGHDVHIEVIGFDQEQVVLYRGPGSGFGERQIDDVLARGALGTSDLAAALHAAKRVGKRGSRVIVLSDGIATAGEKHAGALANAAADARTTGITRIDAIVQDSASDRAALEAVTVQPAGSAGVVIDGASAPDVLVGKLRAPVLHDVAVEVPGSRAVWPRKIDGVQAGDSVLVYAELDERTPLRVQFQGALLLAQQVATEKVERALLERAWGGAQLRELLAQHDQLGADDATRTALRAKIIDLSLAHRVLSPFTAMLVLETDADYRQFGLDRRGLSNILVVGDAGLDVLQRDPPSKVLPGARKGAKDPSRSVTVPVEPVPGGPTGVDSDRDGIADGADACPMQPEDPDGHEDGDGCPELLRYAVCTTHFDRLYFKPRSAVIRPAWRDVLDDVVAILKAAPEIHLWVDGHTDSFEQADPRLSRTLSQRRADAVVKYLVAAGVDPRQVAPRGMGGEAPIDDNETWDGRAANRRVDFSIAVCMIRTGHKRWSAAQETGEQALEGKFLAVDDALGRDPADALRIARTWWAEQPGDVLAALALGRGLAAVGQRPAAARAYGSLIDLSPSRAEFRRHAGQRLEGVGALELAIDSYRQAVSLRPEHPSSHRLLAFALARTGRYAEAFAAAQTGLVQNYAPGRYPQLHVIQGEDLAILGAAWIRSEPAAAAEVERRLARLGLGVATTPSLRFVLTWESDASDVDVRVLDSGQPVRVHGFDGGFTMYVDNSEGYGPESLVLHGGARAYPYTVRVFYASRRAMSHAMGAVQVLEHDGHGRLGFATLPFVLMREGASLDIGVVPGSLIAGGDSAHVPTGPKPPK